MSGEGIRSLSKVAVMRYLPWPKRAYHVQIANRSQSLMPLVRGLFLYTDTEGLHVCITICFQHVPCPYLKMQSFETTYPSYLETQPSPIHVQQSYIASCSTVVYCKLVEHKDYSNWTNLNFKKTSDPPKPTPVIICWAINCKIGLEQTNKQHSYTITFAVEKPDWCSWSRETSLRVMGSMLEFPSCLMWSSTSILLESHKTLPSTFPETNRLSHAKPLKIGFLPKGI